jgi:hypothetical protein
MALGRNGLAAGVKENLMEIHVVIIPNPAPATKFSRFLPIN